MTTDATLIQAELLLSHAFKSPDKFVIFDRLTNYATTIEQLPANGSYAFMTIRADDASGALTRTIAQKIAQVPEKGGVVGLLVLSATIEHEAPVVILATRTI